MATKRGLGSIRKLASGRYQVRYTDPIWIRRSGRITLKVKRKAEFEGVVTDHWETITEPFKFGMV